VLNEFSGRRASIVTSIAMFYDLDSPLDFMRQIERILADDGVWAMEQSYLPAMLRTTGYDTICHEHLEYYAVHQIAWMARRAGLKIIQVEENTVNGGSFAVLLAKEGSSYHAAEIGEWLSRERNLTEPAIYERFERQVEGHRKDLLRFLDEARKRGDVVLGYGASTKGNVILQYCGLTARDIPCIGEVNSDKFGAFTPGTRIPIVPEAEVKARRPAYLLVLPWHFRAFIEKKEADYVRSGGRLAFPLPTLETVP
jgi:NDP-4-keto-2,6-dideoxyhexose 3-C-methyltransferase